jgi:assimilatory nitrate reductase electron transfer subunit
MPDATVVCRCNAVTKGTLTRAWLQDGARDLAAATRAGTGCGSCQDVVERIVAWLSTVDTPGGEAAA